MVLFILYTFLASQSGPSHFLLVSNLLSSYFYFASFSKDFYPTRTEETPSVDRRSLNSFTQIECNIYVVVSNPYPLYHPCTEFVYLYYQFLEICEDTQTPIMMALSFLSCPRVT
jgi:hypothetical protein